MVVCPKEHEKLEYFAKNSNWALNVSSDNSYFALVVWMYGVWLNGCIKCVDFHCFKVKVAKNVLVCYCSWVFVNVWHGYFSVFWVRTCCFHFNRKKYKKQTSKAFIQVWLSFLCWWTLTHVYLPQSSHAIVSTFFYTIRLLDLLFILHFVNTCYQWQ